MRRNKECLGLAQGGLLHNRLLSDALSDAQHRVGCDAWVMWTHIAKWREGRVAGGLAIQEALRDEGLAVLPVLRVAVRRELRRLWGHVTLDSQVDAWSAPGRCREHKRASDMGCSCVHTSNARYSVADKPIQTRTPSDS